jgi:hypothetical protein
VVESRNSQLSAAAVEMLSLRPPRTTFSHTLSWPRRGRLGGAAAPHYVSAAAPAAAAPPESVSFPIMVRIPLSASNVMQTCSMKRCYGDYWLSFSRARLLALLFCAMVSTQHLLARCNATAGLPVVLGLASGLDCLLRGFECSNHSRFGFRCVFCTLESLEDDSA